ASWRLGVSTSAALALMALLPLSACRTAGAPRASSAATVAQPPLDPPHALAALASEYWDTHLQRHPLEATDISDRRFDDRLGDNPPAGRDQEIAALTALRARVAAVPPGALSAGDRVTRSLLIGEIDTGLAFGSCQLDDWTVDARDGTQVAFLRLPELQPVR